MGSKKPRMYSDCFLIGAIKMNAALYIFAFVVIAIISAVNGGL